MTSDWCRKSFANILNRKINSTSAGCSRTLRLFSFPSKFTQFIIDFDISCSCYKLFEACFDLFFSFDRVYSIHVILNKIKWKPASEWKTLAFSSQLAIFAVFHFKHKFSFRSSSIWSPLFPPRHYNW